MQDGDLEQSLRSSIRVRAGRNAGGVAVAKMGDLMVGVWFHIGEGLEDGEKERKGGDGGENKERSGDEAGKLDKGGAKAAALGGCHIRRGFLERLARRHARFYGLRREELPLDSLSGCLSIRHKSESRIEACRMRGR